MADKHEKSLIISLDKHQINNGKGTPEGTGCFGAGVLFVQKPSSMPGLPPQTIALINPCAEICKWYDKTKGLCKLDRQLELVEKIAAALNINETDTSKE